MREIEINNCETQEPKVLFVFLERCVLLMSGSQNFIDEF